MFIIIELITVSKVKSNYKPLIVIIPLKTIQIIPIIVK